MTYYDNITKLFNSNKDNITQECNKDLKYLQKLTIQELHIIRMYILGVLMEAKLIKSFNLNKFLKTYTDTISSSLKHIISKNKPRKLQFYVYQGQIETVDIIPKFFKVGEIITRPEPFSTTMYYPMAFEWIINKLKPEITQHNSILNALLMKPKTIPKNKLLVCYVYKIPKKSKISLCVGCPERKCTSNFKNFINKGLLRSVKTFLSMESEVIVNCPIWKVEKTNIMQFKDIKNFEKYDKKFIDAMQRKITKSSTPIHIVYLTPATLENSIDYLIDTNKRTSWNNLKNVKR